MKKTKSSWKQMAMATSNWNGKWETQEDEILKGIMDQDMGIAIDLSAFEELSTQG